MKNLKIFIAIFILLTMLVGTGHTAQSPLVAGETWGTTRAKINANDADLYATKQNILGFTPENVANRVTSFSGAGSASYPTVNAVLAYLASYPNLSAVSASIAAATMNCLYSTGSYSDPSWLPSLSMGKITGLSSSLALLAPLNNPTFTLGVTSPLFTASGSDGARGLILGTNTAFTPVVGNVGIINIGGTAYYYNSDGGLHAMGSVGTSVSDTAYGTAWNGDTTTAPSKNAVYDKIETLAAGAAPTVQASDPTSSSGVGWYLATTSGHTFYKTASGLFDVSAGTYTADPTAPTITGISIPPAGTTMEVAFSASVSVGAGGSAGWTLSNGKTVTYTSGLPGTTAVYTLSAPVYSTDSAFTAAYTQPVNGLEATSGGLDVATASGISVTNGSTQTGGSAGVMGYTTTTSITTWDTHGAGQVGGLGGTASASGTVGYVHVYADNIGASYHYNVAVYDAGGGKLAEGTLTTGLSAATPTWLHFALKTPISVTSGTSYKIVFGSSDDTDFRLGSVTVAGYTAYYQNTMTVADTMPVSWSWTSDYSGYGYVMSMNNSSTTP